MNLAPLSPRTPKIGKYLGISLMAVGAFFLFDPFISVVDLLPDALGYLFLWLGLYRLSDLDERIMEASKGLRYLALIGVVRVAALLLAFGFVSPTEQPVFILLALFTLGVLDCIVLIPLWKNLCGGLTYLGSRNDAVTMFHRPTVGGRQSSRNLLERYTAYSTVFFVLREVLAVLPEFTVLSHEKGGVELDEATRFYDFVGMYRLVGGFLSLILGLVWLVWTLFVLRRLKSDIPFFERLAVKYRTEVLTRHELFAMRSVKLALGCLTAAAVCSLDLYLDGINMLPDGLAAIFLLLSILLLRQYTGKNLPAVVTSVVYGLTAAFGWLLQIKGFCRVTDLPNLHRDADLQARWQTSVLLQAVTAALFMAAVILILRALYALVKRYTGVHAFRDSLSAGNGYAAERTEAIHTLIRKKLIAVGVLAGLVALSTLFQWGVIPGLPELDLTLSGADAQTRNVLDTVITTVYQILTEGYWFVDLAIGGIWIGTIVSASGEISDQMEYSAMMRE
jgi:hypothetical protein